MLPPFVLETVKRALDEDIGSGDATSLSTIPEDLQLDGVFRAKSAGVVAGLDVVEAVFREVSSAMELRQRMNDGDRAKPGDVIAEITGSGRAMLSAERTAMNFLQRMSGIATLTRAYVDAVAGTRAVILDTRKTAPGLRVLDKMAVRIGGGSNHRIGLFDMILIKDNHIDAAGGISAAMARVRANRFADLPIEIECRTLADVDEAARLGVGRLMFDNMTIEIIREAVRLVGGRVPIEISGGVTLENVRALAETGVQFISVGALTHSAAAMDVSMVLCRAA